MQADQIFYPDQRLPRKARDNWSTLVVIIGVTESKTKFEEDAKWWFTNSRGGVRIVVIILVTMDETIFEKREHLPDIPAHSTRQYMGNGERYYCAQKAMVTSNGVTGAPMKFPSKDLLDRDPQNKETDIVLNDEDFHYMTRTIFDPRIDNALLEKSN